MTEAPTGSSYRQHRFHVLDAMRGIAAVLVVFRHAPLSFTQRLGIYNSFLSVDFFFLLSGFVIGFSYEQRLLASMTWKDFAIVRFVRLYPLSILATLLATLDTLWSLHLEHATHYGWYLLRDVLLSMALIPKLKWYQWPTDPVFPLDIVLWSLLFEIAANLLYAMLLRLRIRGVWTLGIIAAVALVSLLWLLHAGASLHTIDGGFAARNFMLGFYRVGFSFFVGVLLYRLYLHVGQPNYGGTGVGIFGVLACGCLAYVLIGRAQFLQNVPANLVTVCCIFPALLWVGANLRLPVRATVLCVFLGEISYPVYVLQGPALWFLKQPASMAFSMQHRSQAALAVLLFVAVLVIAAWVFAAFYDRPVRRYLTAQLRRAPRPAAVLGAGALY